MNILLWVIKIWKDLLRNPWQPVYLVPFFVINFTGSIYGYWWYSTQLAENAWYLWPLISDSPLSTTILAVSLLLGLLERRISLLTAIGLVTTIKYGAWAMVVLTHYWFISGDISLVEFGLWLGHLGMVMEGFIFMKNSRVGRFAAAGAVLWMIINDAVDYIFGLHPYLFAAGQEQLAGASAVLLTVLPGIIMYKKIYNNVV
ncbi:MAG: DUF1405 domain-containing protein [Clostridiales bacterium]|nr:DUF1405 domain-containing protein [Clostridiales bacterium]MCF8021630.1 DUF1405 domain-containing protein [Clostridiales bacterium]